jgi:putative transposase
MCLFYLKIWQEDPLLVGWKNCLGTPMVDLKDDSNYLSSMLRTIKVALPEDDILVQTAIAYNKACQIALNYGFQNKTHSKNKLNRATYRQVRETLPKLPSALVQTARDQASEILRRTGCQACVKKQMSVRYDRRTFKFYPDQNRVSLTTTGGRLSLPFTHYEYMDTWRGEYTSAQLLIRRGRAFLNVQVETLDAEDKEKKERGTWGVLGIDRGVLKVAVCSDNTFFGSSRLRAVKGRYQYQRRVLQRVGTRSARRKLRAVSGRERRFALDVNHCISKAIVSKEDFDVFVVEDLHIRKSKRRGRRFNTLLGSWSPSQLLHFIVYKAETRGKVVVLVDPRYTSLRCSRCGYTDKRNRHGLRFHCLSCGFELHADLNAARNIGVLGKSEYLRLTVNEPIAASHDAAPAGSADGSCKPSNLLGGS